MPTTTYHNLPTQKKQKLIQAARSELSRCPYNLISINKVVQRAGIPRGSFYQYFTDKDDMLTIIFSKEMAGFEKHMLDLLNTTGGDIFEVFRGGLSKIIDIGTKEENISICVNLFAYLPVRPQALTDRLPLACDNHVMGQVLSYVSQNLAEHMTNAQLRNLIEILVSITKTTLVRCFSAPEKIAEFLEDFDIKLALLKRCTQKDI